MARMGKLLPCALLVHLLLASAVHADAGQLAGTVSGEESPLAAATVYAFKIADRTLRKAITDPQGSFLFETLPAGLYKIIAFKAGFVTGVVLLTRTRPEANQFLELELARAEGEESGESAAGFWSLRQKIPPDVLRDIAASEYLTRMARIRRNPSQPWAQMEAMAGVEQLGTLGDFEVAGGGLGVQSQVGPLRVGVKGDYYRFTPVDDALVNVAGKAASISLEVASPQASVLQFDSTTHRGFTLEDGRPAPSGFDRYRISWSQPVGEAGHSSFAAQYVSENNFYDDRPILPLGVPNASQTLHLEGSYSASVGARTTVETSIRYRERKHEFGYDLGLDRLMGFPTEERIDLFGGAGWEAQPAVLVEYGLYTTLQDGSLSLMPQGGMVLHLGPKWQAATRVSHRLYEDDEARLDRSDFIPALYSESDDPCQRAGDACYNLDFSRDAEDQSLSIGASHWEVGETLRLYFNEDFATYPDSLYVVRGDRLPALKVALSRQISPKILARLESNIGAGGGGIFYATDHAAYENEVRYFITSLDTHFQGTDTGVFVAFHHLQQQLSPMNDEAAQAVSQLDSERLQVMLTQDLSLLLDLAADWAIKLNMELSRGLTPLQAALEEDEIRKRIVGGIAVKF